MYSIILVLILPSVLLFSGKVSRYDGDSWSLSVCPFQSFLILNVNTQWVENILVILYTSNRAYLMTSLILILMEVTYFLHWLNQEKDCLFQLVIYEWYFYSIHLLIYWPLFFILTYISLIKLSLVFLLMVYSNKISNFFVFVNV